MRLLLLLVALPLWGADDVTSILTRFIEAQPRNDKRAKQYTYVEHTDRFGYDKAGHLKKGSSETSEIIFVEGLEYKKLVAKNGKPLSAKEQAKVEKEMRQTAEERRKHSASAAGWRKNPGGEAICRPGIERRALDAFR